MPFFIFIDVSSRYKGRLMFFPFYFLLLYSSLFVFSSPVLVYNFSYYPPPPHPEYETLYIPKVQDLRKYCQMFCLNADALHVLRPTSIDVALLVLDGYQKQIDRMEIHIVSLHGGECERDYNEQSQPKDQHVILFNFLCGKRFYSNQEEISTRIQFKLKYSIEAKVY